MARKWTEHNLTEHMLKRLAQLASPSGDHNHGTSMGALHWRGMVEDGPIVERPLSRSGYPLPPARLPCCVITDKGREALAEARAEGW